MKHRVAKKLKEKGCSEDHQFRLTRRIDTYPAIYVYECEDCDNEAKVRKSISTGSKVGDYI